MPLRCCLETQRYGCGCLSCVRRWRQSQWKLHLNVFLNTVWFIRLGNDNHVSLDKKPDQNLGKGKEEHERRGTKKSVQMHFVFSLTFPPHPHMHKPISLSTTMFTFLEDSTSLHTGVRCASVCLQSSDKLQLFLAYVVSTSWFLQDLFCFHLG